MSVPGDEAITVLAKACAAIDRAHGGIEAGVIGAALIAEVQRRRRDGWKPSKDEIETFVDEHFTQRLKEAGLL